MTQQTPADKQILDTFFTQNEDRPSDHIQRTVGPVHIPISPNVENALYFQPTFISQLAQNGASVVRCDQIPEFWWISVPPKAAVTVRVYAGAFSPGSGATPIIELGGGGSVQLMIRSKEITIMNSSAGATPTNVNVIATRNCDLNIQMGIA